MVFVELFEEFAVAGFGQGVFAAHFPGFLDQVWHDVGAEGAPQFAAGDEVVPVVFRVFEAQL